jgi:hypothetical protein
MYKGVETAVKKKSKIPLIVIIIICFLIFVAIPATILITIFSYYSPHTRSEVKGILDRSLTVDYKYISTQRFYGERREIVRTFKDENGIYFNVVSYYGIDYFMPYMMSFCNYHQILFLRYFDDIEIALSEHLSQDEFKFTSREATGVSDRINDRYDFYSFMEYRIDIYDDCVNAAKERVTAAVTAAINAAPDFPIIIDDYFKSNTQKQPPGERFRFNGFPSIVIYYNDKHMGTAHFHPDLVIFYWSGASPGLIQWSHDFR